jgi:hypothetical protein
MPGATVFETWRCLLRSRFLLRLQDPGSHPWLARSQRCCSPLHRTEPLAHQRFLRLKTELSATGRARFC